MKTGKEIYSFQAASDLVKFIGTSPDGDTIIGNLGNVITLWNLKTGQEICSLTVKLRNLRTKSELRSFKALSNPIKFVAMNSHSQTLVTVNCNDTITLWDLKVRKEIRTIEWRSDKGRSLVVSFDCQTFIDFNYGKVGKSEGVTIWDLYRGEKIKTIASDAVQYQSLVLDANQHTIVYASGYWGIGELVKVWRLL